MNETTSVTDNTLSSAEKLGYEIMIENGSSSNDYDIRLKITNDTDKPSDITFIQTPISIKYIIKDQNGVTINEQELGNLTALNTVRINPHDVYVDGHIEFSKQSDNKLSITNIISYYEENMIQERIITQNF